MLWVFGGKESGAVMCMPQYENCRHSGDGWCLNCVKKLSDRMAFMENLATRAVAEGWIVPQVVEAIAEYDRKGGVAKT